MVGTEAAIVSAVISGTLKIVGSKLAPLLIKEYSSIVGVTKDLQELHGLVEEINCWLETVNDKAMASAPSLKWLKNLKDVSYDVDDLVDEFHLEADKNEADGDGDKHTVSKCNCLLRKPKSFMLRRNAAHKIKAIKKRFAAIVKQRTDFSAIANSVPLGHSVQHINKTTWEMPSLPIVDEASVLGRDQEMYEIISTLVDINDQPAIKIVSVIGLGGSGKTTLAKLVFNHGNIIQNFEVKLWVHVSQEFDVANLIEKLFEAIAGEKSERYPLQQMVKTISNKLTGKRFLLVLDDIWTEDRIHWEEFMVHIKSGAPGSRVLLTTRSRKVAEAVESTDPFNLPFLSKVDSWAVFNQSFGMGINVLDSEFLEVGREIVNKCGGVPLAIKVFAGVLLNKKRVEEWQAMRDSNLLNAEDKERRVFACLMLSYSHLPSHLKQCFTICSLFPKGRMIDKEQLIDQWIAHDMITAEDGVDYLEYSGNKCFSSLVQMSFLQEVHETYDGRMQCRMHDLVHDLAVYILGEEISVGVPKETTNSTKKYRYFSITKRPRNLLPKNYFEKARAIYVSACDDFISGKAAENAKHLRSITVRSIYATSVPTSILQIKNLRYLCILFANFETLPENISDIWSLQALHLTNCQSLLKLPESIGKLRKLRTLNLSDCTELRCLPDSIGHCSMISRIDLHRCEKITALPNSIDRNQNLRVLRLGFTKIERLPTGITTLGNLECLDLQWCSELVELPEGLGKLKKLEVLNLEGCGSSCLHEKIREPRDKWGHLGGTPVGIGQLTRVRKLGLFVVGDGKESAQISELGNMGRISGDLTISNIAHGMNPNDAYKACLKQKTNLQMLKLNWSLGEGATNTENELAVLDGLEPPSGIQILEIEGYAGGQCAQWMLGQVGSRVQGLPHFSRLTQMCLEWLPSLKHLQLLVELPCLRGLRLVTMPALESISGGPFPSLVKLHMQNLPRLEEVWIKTEETLADGEDGGGCSNGSPQSGHVQIGNRLSHLVIKGCPKLMVYFPSSPENLPLLSPGQGQAGSSSGAGLHSSRECISLSSSLLPSTQHLASLQTLEISFCSALLQLPEWPMALRCLLALNITNYNSITFTFTFPQSLKQLTSLQNLVINDLLGALHQLPDWLGELRSLQSITINGAKSLRSLPDSLVHLTSLQELSLGWCDVLQLPEWLGEVRSLRKLVIWDLPGLTCLPQSMRHLDSLEELHIDCCPGLTSLPEWIQGLTALQRLFIDECPDLERRCERGKGEDWHLISHIPRLWIP